MSRLRELYQEKQQTLSEARQIVEQAEREKRDLTSDESQQYERANSRLEELRNRIAREEKLQEEERQAAEREADGPPAGDQGEQRAGATGEQMTPEQRTMNAFGAWLRSGRFGDVEGAQEFRDLQAGIDPQGGYLIAPQTFVNQLIQEVDDQVVIRQLATTQQITSAHSLGVPSLDKDPSDPDWTTELSTGSEDVQMALGQRSLTPHPLAKRIKLSNKLVRMANQAEALVRRRLGYKFAVAEEKGYLTGDGNQKPLGVFTASNNGISTSRDVANGNNSDSVTFDGLINAKYALKQQYWPRTRWVMHRDTAKQIRKLKDNDGQYLWQENTRQGEPDRLLGFPVTLSEFAPNSFTSGDYVAILGDFSNYWIVDALDMQMQRLTELYAESNQIGFIGRKETDGMPSLEEPFVRAKLA